MVGVEFADLHRVLPRGTRALAGRFDERLKGGLAGLVGALLLEEHGILVAFTEYNRNVVRLEPPLVVTREQVDTMVDALDDVLARGFTRIAMDYVRRVKFARA
jgi:acetylornithine/succinyldiaminopimelate/putrescine aminotransferase